MAARRQHRVAAVHHQTRRGLLAAAAFTMAAGLAAALPAAGLPARSGWWLPLHLFIVGGLLSAISATTQLLAVTWSAAPAARRSVASTQRWCLAGGAIALVAGREFDRPALFVGGGIAVVIAVAAIVPILVQIRRRALTHRFSPAIDAYIAACLAGAVGMSLGIVVGTGRAGVRTMELRGAHLVLNLYGLVGLVIVATLPYFTATQVRRKMSRRATPAAMRATLLVLGVATAIAAAGRIIDRPGVAAGGLLAYAGGLVAVAALLPLYGRNRLAWAGARAVQLVAGLGWWAAMTVALAVADLRGHADRPILQAMVIGGFAQILAASLAYLGPVLRGGQPQQLTAGFRATHSWLSVVAANVAAVGSLSGHGPVVLVALIAWLVDAVARAVRLLFPTQERTSKCVTTAVAGDPDLRPSSPPSTSDCSN